MKPENRPAPTTVTSYETGTVFDAAGIAMAVVSGRHATILFCNRETEYLSGYRKEDLERKKTLFHLVHPWEMSKWLDYVRQWKEGTHPDTYPISVSDRYGHKKNVLIKTRNINNSEAVVVTITDISDFAQLETKLKESEEKFRLLFENARDGIYQSTPDGQIILANPAFVRLLGYDTLEEVLSVNTKNLYANPKRRTELLKLMDKHGSIKNEEIEWLKKDGTTVFILSSGRAILKDGKISCFEHTVIDITEQKRAQKELEKSRQYFIDIINCLPDPTFAIDRHGKVIAWNKAIEQLTNTPAREMVGKDNYEYAIPFYGTRKPILIDYVLNPGLEKGAQYSYMINNGDTIVAEAYSPNLRKGEGIYLWGSASLIRDNEGNVMGAINIIKDITYSKETQKQLRFLSIHDSLTGLYNRSYFEEEILRLSNSRYQPLTVILCDVDGLKMINDSMGHHKGDELLKAAAGALRSAFRSSDAVSRIGGDEFAILLPNTDLEAAHQAYTRIMLAVDDYNQTNPTFPLSLSAGFASGQLPIKDIIVEADNYLNRNKLHRSRSTKSHLTSTLMAMLAERDYITEGHADRLESLAGIMADAAALSPQDKSILILLAKFHDIGKVGIPDKLLFKPSALTKEEREEMRRHSEIGYRIAISSPELSHIASYILHHHEWWDGNGYPLGLAGEKIPLPCRILSILDAYDAMTSDRPYRNAMTCNQAAAEIKSQSGTQFDPNLVEIFLNILQTTDCLSALTKPTATLS